ncbi:histidine-containing phosphotransfer protein 2-like [Carya illinoinensis]|uniref:histidine-containing phosphotransfer protein 2-like n=1 Tax=Carya illinoinensis TaxID=32201 RepID=UPI001C7247ED|nr:histidine-containing phosphotransfer protein 2-like [Carya illinoinensis]
MCVCRNTCNIFISASLNLVLSDLYIIYSNFIALIRTMASNFLTQHIGSFRMSLFVEGFLGDQFTELEKLEDDQNPLFIERVVNVFLKETPNDITRIGQILEDTPLDVVKLDRCIHKLKGRSVRYLFFY